MDFILSTFGQAFRLLLSGSGDIYAIIALSLRITSIAVLIAGLIGVPLGAAIAMKSFPGKGLVTALVYTGFALPPVVVGLLIYMLLSRQGPLAGLELLFTPTAMTISQIVLALPYITGITLASVSAIPGDVRLQARALGASRLRAALTHLRECSSGIMAAVLAGFGATMSEVGAVQITGGNIAGETRVMTTAIVLETRRGNFATALAFGIVLLLLAFAVNALLTRAQHTRVTRAVHRTGG
jgi:tungstate transport system permease protein